MGRKGRGGPQNGAARNGRHRCPQPQPAAPSDLSIRDEDDRWVLASAVAGAVDVLVTGDRDLLDVAVPAPVNIVDPRGFWELANRL